MCEDQADQAHSARPASDGSAHRPSQKGAIEVARGLREAGRRGHDIAVKDDIPIGLGA